MARIGIDLDDTITDIKDEMLKEALNYDKTLRGVGIINNDSYFLGERFDWSQEERDYFLKNNRLNVVENARIRENALEVLEKLSKKHEIIIITARSNKYYQDPYNYTYDWLKRNNIPFSFLVTDSIDKYSICKKLKIDYFIDDNLDNCLSVSKLGIKVFRMDNGYGFKDNTIPVIYSFLELESIIK